MSRKRFTPAQIIGKVREAEVALAQGQTTGQVCRTLLLSGKLTLKDTFRYSLPPFNIPTLRNCPTQKGAPSTN